MSGPPPPAPLSPEEAAQNKGPLILALTWTFTSLAALLVAGRVVSRRSRLGKLRADDWIIIGSLILCFVFLGFVTTSVHYGSGRHAATLSIPDLEKAIFYITIGFVPGILSFTVPKFAVILLLCELLNPSRIHRWVMWIMAAINFLAIVACIIVVYGSCNPPSAMWDLSIPRDQVVCWHPNVTVYSSLFAGAFSAFMDLYLAIYPAIVLWQLQMNLKKKLGLSVALGFGICAGAVAIHKCTTIPGVGNKTDFTYGTEDLILWTNLEANCVIIAACVPMLLPLVEMVFGRHFLASGGKTSYLRFERGAAQKPTGPTSRRTAPSAKLGGHRGGGSSTNASTADPYGDLELELGDGIPCKTEISGSPVASRFQNSQESILRGEEGPMRIVRHNRVVVEYENADNETDRRQKR